jgi:hypothetical protein
VLGDEGHQLVAERADDGDGIVSRLRLHLEMSTDDALAVDDHLDL